MFDFSFFYDIIILYIKELGRKYEVKMKEDYSNICNGDDDDTTNPCWECIYFCFPIGCMKGEEENEKSDSCGQP